MCATPLLIHGVQPLLQVINLQHEKLKEPMIARLDDRTLRPKPSVVLTQVGIS